MSYIFDGNILIVQIFVAEVDDFCVGWKRYNAKTMREIDELGVKREGSSIVYYPGDPVLIKKGQG